MGQVNINYDDAILKGIDRVAGARGVSRSDLLRVIAREEVEAYEDGRLAFQREDDAPRVETSLNALAIQLREGVVE